MPVQRGWVALTLDLACVLLFVTVGRGTHDGDQGPWQVLSGLGSTAWPFLVGLALGWLVTRAWQAPRRPWPTGVLVWLCTLVGGMLLRRATGEGTAAPFVAVATVVLGLELVGWRAVAVRVRPGFARSPT